MRSNGTLQEKLDEFQFEYEIIRVETTTEAKKDIITADFNNFDALISVGGDGTLFHVLNGYLKNKSEKRIPLGLIPVGTGNALSKDLNLEAGNISLALQAIKKGVTKSFDIGKITDSKSDYYFANIAGCGFVTDVASTAQKLKFLGKLSYTFGVLYRTVFLKPFDVSIITENGEFNHSVIFIEVSNTRFTGSDFLMAPGAVVNDGYLDLTLLKKLSRFRLLQGLLKIFSGTHVHMPEVEVIKSKSMTITTSVPKQLTVDGEIFGYTPVTIDCENNRIEVIVNS